MLRMKVRNKTLCCALGREYKQVPANLTLGEGEGRDSYAIQRRVRILLVVRASDPG